MLLVEQIGGHGFGLLGHGEIRVSGLGCRSGVLSPNNRIQPETRNPKPETRNPKPDYPNVRPDSGSIICQ
jgi:hypothetical protein